MGKKKKISKEDFNRGLNSQFYGPGAGAREMLERYGVEGAVSRHPDGRSGESRSVAEVRKELADAMMKDYHTNETFQNAALAGNKGAKKFAKKGFKSGNLADAWDAYKGLKKEYVGGGGMQGAKNIAGLTYETGKAYRDSLIEELSKREPKMKLTDDDDIYVDNPYEDEPEGLDPFVRETRDSFKHWIDRGTGRTGEGYAGVFPLGRYDGQKGEIVPSPGNEGLDATEERIMDGPSFASDFKRKLMDDLRQAAGYDSTYA